MKTLIIYYSNNGATRGYARALAEETGAELYEVQEAKPLSPLGAALRCPAAMGQKPSKTLLPIEADMAAYDKIVIMGPIWAGSFAPPVNNIIEALPAGKAVEVRTVSAGSGGNQVKIRTQIARQGCTVERYMDIRKGEQDG